jgi:hypothetical protein
VEEIIVHVFDFLYFYGRDIEKYVRSLWLSWGTIPTINSRVKDYVIRTICAALVLHLRREQAEEFARDQVLEQLRSLKDGGSYVQSAISYIESHWANEIYPRVFASKQIVKIVQTFLYSDTIATKIRGETAISGGATDREGYTLKPGTLETTEIRNPLRFLEVYTGSKPQAWESLWMLYVLAFCIKNEAG